MPEKVKEFFLEEQSTERGTRGQSLEQWQVLEHEEIILEKEMQRKRGSDSVYKLQTIKLRVKEVN